MQLQAEEILHIRVICTPSLDVKNNLNGYLRVIPICGGTFDGKITGKVINGGADWNTQKTSNGTAHVFAKYLLQADDGTYIAIENEGIIDPTENRFIQTTPSFTVDCKSPYAWLNYGVYVGSLEPDTGDYSVKIRIYRLD